jgi:hypothetical protein
MTSNGILNPQVGKVMERMFPELRMPEIGSIPILKACTLATQELILRMLGASFLSVPS